MDAIHWKNEQASNFNYFYASYNFTFYPGIILKNKYKNNDFNKKQNLILLIFTLNLNINYNLILLKIFINIIHKLSVNI